MRDNPLGFRYVLMEHIPHRWVPEPGVGAGPTIDHLLEKFMAKEAAFQDVTGADYFDHFDEYILFQAGTMGPPIIMSNLVRDRMRAWFVEPSGPMKLERFGKQLARAARRVQQRKHDRRPITDPGWYPYSQAAKRELKVLLSMIRNTVNVRPSPKIERESLLERISSLIRPAGSQFPELHENLDSLLEYLGEDPHGYRAQLERGAIIRPTIIFEGWGAWLTGYDPARFRNMISALRPRN
ncbi:MAG: hypothetical protein WA817_24350 [Candidatus Acidiferrum sp.]